MKTWLFQIGLFHKLSRKSCGRALAVSLLLTCSTLTIATELRPFDAQYVAYRSGNDIGKASLQLETSSPTESATNFNSKSTQYALTYQSKVSRFFLSDRRYEKSFFIDQNSELVPLSYEYKRTGTGPDKALRVEFNPKINKIIIDDDEQLEWHGELDNQLFRIDLPNKLAQGVTKAHYDFINYRGQKRRYELEVVSTENITLPYGQLVAIKVVLNRESSSRVTYAWFAPSLNHNLVRLQQFKNGKEQGDMQLSEFSYLQ